MAKYKFWVLIIVIFCLFPISVFGQYVSWVRRYNGPVSSDYNDDEPTAITVDNQGNVYVTGNSVGRVAFPYTYTDCATIKYNANGDTMWVRRYNGPANQNDDAYAMAVDTSGNVYVTGSSYTSDSTSTDYLTIKYNSNGDTVWTRRYNGTGNSSDEAYAIAIDNQGNIYITGYSYSATNWDDYLTIKYNPDGDTVWTRSYDGPQNSSDEASALAVDNQDNVYVTGKSYGAGYWYDYATIKYNSTGVQQWVSRYTYTGNNNDEARAIAVDNNGNVYITGYSEQPNFGPGECATVKYNSLGDTVWVRRYSDNAHIWDEGKAIAVENNGNVYVTGGTEMSGWNDNYLTIKYSPSGTQQWIQRYNQPDSTNCYNIASSIALDTSGYIYVTGVSDDYVNNHGQDYATIKYHPSGAQLWVARYDGPAHYDDASTAMTTDLAGNIYVTGHSWAADPDYATIKYYQAGANDVGVDSIIYPPSQHLRLTPMIPCALIKNYGTSPQTNFSVVCSIIGPVGNVRYTNTQNVLSLASYDTVRVYFTSWTPTITESCTVVMRTDLVGDQNSLNDRKLSLTEITYSVLYLTEGFNSTIFPPTGWQDVTVNGGYYWERKTSNTNPTCLPYEGSAMASFQSYSAPAGYMSRLISPPINLGYQSKTCVLNFIMYHDPGEQGASDSVKIEYSTDGINFTRVAGFCRYESGTSDWLDHSVELGIFSGTIYIGILAYSGYGNNMNIDQVQLYGNLPPNNDVGVDEIICPLSTQQAGVAITPSARIKNFGILNQTNFPVACSIISSSGILRYTNTQNVSSLASSDTVRVNFTAWTPMIDEICTVRIKTLLGNDENYSNDQKSKSTIITTEQLFLYEDFNDVTFPPSGWQSIILAGSSNWSRTTSNIEPTCTPYEGVAMASFPSFSSPDGSMARLISPAINLGSAPIPCTLKFAMYHDPGYSSNPDSVRVEYSTDGINFNRVTAFRRYQSYERWVDHSVYLGTFSGTIYVGLVAFSDYGDNINIDYIRMAKFEQYPNDIGVDAIIQPSSSYLINTQMTPIARIKNFGTSAQTTIPAVCSIFGTGGILRYTNSQTIISLAAGETTQVSFASWTPTVAEQCTVKIRTNLLTDQNPYNNLKDLLTEVTTNQVILTEGFNDTIFPPAGWQSVIVQGTTNWERKTSNQDPDCLPYEGTAMASYNSYSATNGSMARLISPPIVLGGTPVLCSLKFFMYHDPGYPSDYGPDSVKVEYSTDGTTFNRVTAFRRYQPTEGWIEYSVYLGTFSGNLYLGLLAYSDYGNNMNIDYVRVSKTLPLSNDVGVERIVAPGNLQISNTSITPIALVKNYGIATQTNFPVVCSIVRTGGVLSYTNTQTIALLAAGDTTRVNFTSWTPTTVDSNLTVIMRTNLTNDQNPANDRKVQVTHIGTYFTLLSEGFNNTTFPPSGWQSIIVNGSYNWERKSFNENPTCSPYEGSAMASYPCWDAYEGEKARLISPAINFGTVPIACSLNFYMYHDSDYYDCYDFVRIEYSTDGVNFIPVDSFLRYAPTPPAWAQHSMYFGVFTGTVYLGILAVSDYGNNINIDLVKLFGRLIANDVGLDAIVYPSAQHAINTPMIPIARVKNYGSVTQSNFQVICSIIGTGTEKEMLAPQDIGIFTDDNKGQSFGIAKSNNNKEILNSKFKILNSEIIRYIDTLRITSLAPGETAQVNFRTWTPTVAELCTVKMKTNLVEDQNQTNDRKTRTTTIMSATTIVSPNGGEAWAGGSNKTIRWRSPQIIARYVLLLSTNSGASYSDTIANNLSPTDSTYNWLVPTLNLRTCRIKLVILDGGGAVLAQDASDADFTIDSQLPSAPMLISPANGLYTRDSLPHFWWHRSTDSEADSKIEKLEDSKTIHVINANQANFLDKSSNLESYNFSIDFASGIANYQLQYAMNLSFTGAVQINVLDTNYQVTSVLSDTTYYWRVRAVDSAGNQGTWSAVWNFEIDRRTPNAPTLIAPINGTWLTNTSVIFNWSQVLFDSKIQRFKDSKITEPSNLVFSNLKITDMFASPVHYILQVDTSRNFLNPVIDTTGLQYDTLVLSQARYSWRVRAYDFAGNQGINSAIDSFGIDNTPPSIPNLISPAQNVILTDSFVPFYWNRSSDNVSGVNNYLINIANNSNFTGAFDTTLLDTTILRKLRDTTYYWRVRATDRANNQSSWSTVRNFIVRTTGIEEEKYNDLPYITMLYSCIPNPVTNRITQISFSIAEPNPVVVKIYNASGNLVKTIVDEFKRPGVYNISWNCQDEYKRRVAEGIYFYALETPKQKFTKKLILTR